MSLPECVPPLRQHSYYYKDLPLNAPFQWLSAGMRDLSIQPGLSLFYGVMVAVISFVIVIGLVTTGHDYILLPALSAFIIVGPILAIGLYEKSRRLSANEQVTLKDMLFVKMNSRGQVWFVGVLLLLVVIAWIRSAVLIYALFFGVKPFPAGDDILSMLVYTPTGWAILLVGTFVGGLFAAFAFAISFLAVPQLLDRNVDALTAMGTSLATAWANKKVTIIWGGLVAAMIAASILTAFLGLIFFFPLLGHATWHAYQDYKDVLTV